MHDSCVVVSLLEGISIVLTVKILVIFKVAMGLAPWASVWCGGDWANAYPLKSLTGGSYSSSNSKNKIKNIQLVGRSNCPVVTIFAGGLKAGADAG